MPPEASFQFLMFLELGRGSQPRRRSSGPTRELEFPLSPVLRLTLPLRPLSSSSPVLVSPLTLPLSTPSSSARAGFLRDSMLATLLITLLSRRSLLSRDNFFLPIIRESQWL